MYILKWIIINFILLTILSVDSTASNQFSSNFTLNQSQLEAIQEFSALTNYGIYFVIAELIFIIFSALLIFYRVYMVYNFEKFKVNKMYEICKTGTTGITMTDALETCRKYGADFEGSKGLARTLMALNIIFIVGLTVLYCMLAVGLDQQSVGNLVSALAATVATIVGFYFGTKAVEAGEQKEEREWKRG